MMTTMTGKAQGWAAGALGVYGRFSDTFDGHVAAVSWRDGQTTPDPHLRPLWRIGVRGGYLWCLPPGPMTERFDTDPDWCPDWPFDLEPLAVKIRLCEEAEAAGLPAPGVLPPSVVAERAAAAREKVAG